jgi:hypothetical protein
LTITGLGFAIRSRSMALAKILQVNPNVAKAGGLQSQGAKGEAAVTPDCRTPYNSCNALAASGLALL